MVSEKLARHGVESSLASAGFLFDGRSADNVMAGLVRPAGIDLSTHQSRKLTAELVNAADLVITMERRHAREIIVLAPDAAHRVHTLGGLVRTATAAPPDVTLEESLSFLAEQRSFGDLMGEGGPDEVPDPHKKAKRHYRSALESLDRLTSELASWIATRRL